MQLRQFVYLSLSFAYILGTGTDCICCLYLHVMAKGWLNELRSFNNEAHFLGW